LAELPPTTTDTLDTPFDWDAQGSAQALILMPTTRVPCMQSGGESREGNSIRDGSQSYHVAIMRDELASSTHRQVMISWQIWARPLCHYCPRCPSPLWHSGCPEPTLVAVPAGRLVSSYATISEETRLPRKSGPLSRARHEFITRNRRQANERAILGQGPRACCCPRGFG
jgi:hypothetical protein